jgi:hypothetical protein
VGRLVDMGFMGCFVMRGLEMQLYLLGNALIGWLGIFCMASVMYRRGAISWNRYRDLLSASCIKRKILCIVRKGEKQVQILDGY